MSETNDDGAVEYGGRVEETLDEIGQRFAAPTPQNLSEIKLDGEAIPSHLRGKSVSELIELQTRAQEALRISEDARLALKNSQDALTDARRAPATPPPAAPTPEPELTEEQLDALFQESPRKYHDYLNQQTEKRVLRTVQSAISPVVGNSADMAIRDAANRFPDEFAAFGKDIQSFISTMPDKAALAAPGAVDELMDWMRGKHWKKFQEHLNSKEAGDLATARNQMRNQTPQDFSRNPQPPGKPAGGGGNGGGPVQLDDTMKEIADALGVSYEDYAKGLTQRDLRMMKAYADR